MSPGIEPLEARIAPASIALGSGTTNSTDPALVAADTLSAILNAVAGSGKLVATGTVTITGAKLDLDVSRPLADLDTFTLVDNDGTDAVAGAFAGLPEGTVFEADSTLFRISYVGGDGNDITLKALVPNVTIATGGKSATFEDTDGDLVTVTTTKGTLTRANFLLVPTDDLLDRAQLAKLVLGTSFRGADISITSLAAGGGNGFVDVGAIKAPGVSLGKVAIDGDVGQIDAGGSGLTIGIASLTVNSLGLRGTATQLAVLAPTTDNPAPELVSTITGELTTLKVLGDVKDARLRVVDGKDSSGNITTAAKLGSVTVGGSLIGRTAVEAASDDTGVIECDRGIGAIKITDIVGGGGKNSGRISAGGSTASLTITGSITGGAGANSGFVSSFGNVGAVSIGGDLAGGAGEDSGFLRTFGRISSLTIGDDILAGTGAGSGSVRALSAISKILVKGDIDARIASAGAGSASIFANSLPIVTVNGSIFGGAGAGSGVIESGRDIGTVTLATLTTPMLVTGITILGSVNGGAGDSSGAILASGAVKIATIKGSLIGAAGRESGVLRSGLDFAQPGALSTAIINGTIEGGAGDGSGAVIAGGSLGTLTLGSITAPTADVLKGGTGVFSGSISARGKITTVKITGDVLSGGSVLSYERPAAEGDLPGSIGTVTISGDFAGQVRADGGLSALTAGSWSGGSLVTGAGLLGDGNAGTIRVRGDIAQATISVGGKLKLLSVGDDTTGATLRVLENISALTFAGDVSASSFLALNPDAQIGTVSVLGNWTASNLAAGVSAGVDQDFGTIDDVKATGEDLATIVSRIASVTIAGAVSGAAGEDFGFVAQLVSKMKVGTTTYALNTLADSQAISVVAGVTIREVALV